jgi:hypothetical protein
LVVFACSLLTTISLGVFGESALRASSRLAAAYYQPEPSPIFGSSYASARQQETAASTSTLQTTDTSPPHSTTNRKVADNDVDTTNTTAAESSHTISKISHRSDKALDELNSDDSIASDIK